MTAALKDRPVRYAVCFNAMARSSSSVRVVRIAASAWRRGEAYGRYQYATEETVVLGSLPCWRHLSIKAIWSHVKDLLRDIEREASLLLEDVVEGLRSEYPISPVLDLLRTRLLQALSHRRRELSMAPNQLAAKKPCLSSSEGPALDAGHVLHTLLRLDFSDVIVEPFFQLLGEAHYPVDEAKKLEDIVFVVAFLIEPPHQA